jgi:hypothetical protein
MKPSEILRAARKKIEKPECWTKDRAARRIDGKGTYEQDPRAVCWCMTGATAAVDLDDAGCSADTYLVMAVGEQFVPDWNDDPSRTHAEVLAAFDRAIELAEKEGR